MSNVYTFRDSEDILKYIENGKRSKYIRDAIERKVNADKLSYNSRMEIKDQIIFYYNKDIQELDELLDVLEKQKHDIIKLKENINDKKEESIKEFDYIKELNDVKTCTDEMNIKQQNTLKIAITVLLQEIYDDNVVFEFQYFQKMGKFRSKRHFINSLIDYVDENIGVNDSIGGHVICMEDIYLLKEMINKYN